MGESTLDAETQAKILRQVEFYFSDSNLPGDKFLLKAIEDAPDGLVSLPLICSFSRMRTHLGLKEHGADTVPPETTNAVAEVLRKSTALRLSEDGLKVGRTEKLKAPSEVQAEVDNRSLAVCPFPWNVTLDEVESFFKEECRVNSVRLPRLAGAKCFSGFAVVEFVSEEEAERVRGLKLSFQGAELESISKKAFEELQVINGQKAAKNSNGKGRHESGRGEEEEDGYPKGTVVSLTLTRKGGEEIATDVSEEKIKDADEEGGEEGSKETAVDTESQVSREDLKEVLKKFGKVNFVDFSRGDKAGFVRFELPLEAQQARAAAVLAPDGGFLIKEHIVTLNPVEGEAEKDYWKKLREGQGKRRENVGRGGFNDSRGRGGRGGGKFGGKGGRGGRGGGKRDEGRGIKHKRFDDNEDGGERKAAKTD